MTLDEVKEEKKLLEKTILNLITDFNDKTGLIVEDIMLGNTTVSLIGGSDSTMLTHLKIDVKI